MLNWFSIIKKSETECKNCLLRQPVFYLALLFIIVFMNASLSSFYSSGDILASVPKYVDC